MLAMVLFKPQAVISNGDSRVFRPHSISFIAARNSAEINVTSLLDEHSLVQQTDLSTNFMYLLCYLVCSAISW